MLLGRVDELDALDAALITGSPIVLLGEAGVGKTTLLRAAATRTGRQVHEGGALATLSWSAYLPLRRAFPNAMAHTFTGDPEHVATAVADRLGDDVLLVDDLQWADPATLRVLEMLAGRVALLTAVRRGAPAAADRITALAAIGFTVLAVEPLPPALAAELIRSLRSDLDADQVGALLARSGGNPLLIEELALTDTPSESLRLAVLARLRALGPEPLDGMALLAVAGRPLPGAGLPGAPALAEAGLITVAGGWAAARHALLAEVVADQLDDDHRRDCHARLAEILTEPGDVARHHLAAGNKPEGYAAAMVAVESAGTPGERAAHLLTAARCVSGRVESALLLRAARASVEAGEFTAAQDLLAALPDGDEVAARAALLHAEIHNETGEREAARQAIEVGLLRCPASAPDIRVALEVEHIRAEIFAGDVGTGLEDAQAVVAAAERQHFYRGRAHYVLGTALYLLGHPGWSDEFEEAINFARVEGDLTAEFNSANNIVVGNESSGSPAAGVRFADDMISRSAELRLSGWRWHFGALRTNLALHAGDYQLVVRECRKLLSEPVMPRTREQLSGSLLFALVDLGRFAEAMALAEDPIFDSPRIRSDAHHCRAVALTNAGEPVRAMAELEPFLAADMPPGARVLAAPDFAWAARDAAMPDPWPPLVSEPVELPMLAAVPDELGGIRSLRKDDYAAAADSFAAAAKLWAPYHLRGRVRCEWALGEALRLAGRTDDAVEALSAARALAAEHGMQPALARINKSLRGCGVREPARRVGAGGAALSDREREVLSLVGQGLSDAQIGARLGVSPRTVESQVASARRKLGAANRKQAAAMAVAQAAAPATAQS